MENKKKIILIVDDIELNRAILNDLFCRDYEVMEAENGLEALDIIERYDGRIVMILLDIVMPVLDGFGMLKIMEERHLIDRLPVFLITAEDSDDVINKGYDMGVSDVIHKPFNPSVIRRRVGNSIELYSRRLNMESIIQEQTAELENQAEKLKETSLSMVDALSTVIEFRDCESGQHIKRIRIICKTLITELMKSDSSYGFTQQQIDDISMAAAMHDIGKIAIPDYILNKPGKLTRQEFEIMKEHTIRGCEILESVAYIHDSEIYQYYHDICRWHHEKWDGKGYPDGLKREEIPIWAQVVALADCYDALISKRVYKPAYTHGEAVKMIADGECGQFNPLLMDSFIKIAKILEGLNTEREEENVARRYKHLRPEEILSLGASETEPFTDRVTDRTLRLLEMERQRYEVLADMTQDIIFTYYTSGDSIELSDRYREVFNKETKISNVLEGLKQDERISMADRQMMLGRLEELTPHRPSFHQELQMMVPSGEWQWFEIFVYSFWDDEMPGRFARLLGKLTNINKQKEEVNRWKARASMDSLTGLLNRRTVEYTINTLVADEDPSSCFAFLIIDIDNFKAINDGYGHLYGDYILKKVSDIISSTVRSNDVVGRIGGDEFVIVLRDLRDREWIKKKVRQISKLFRMAGEKEKSGTRFTVSIGVSRYPEDGEDYDALLRKADLALYLTKRGGRDGFTFYSPDLEGKVDGFQSVLSEMDR